MGCLRVTDRREQLQAALGSGYAIERELGVGGMATVYLAHDSKHDRDVAIKVLHPDLAAAVGAERFLAEIKTTANLQHPHILPLHDSGTAGGFLYYVMPYVDGETLRTRLNREQRLPLVDALRLMGEVAGALDYAHRAGIVHRDIKPENILISEGHAVVADFGIARAVAQPDASRLTQTGEMVGTPAYLSPEQVSGDALDGRSDLYSLGCVVYECLTGELPFNGSMMAMLAQRMTAAPPSARGKRPEVTAQLDQILLKTMATKSSDRFRTCRELAEALASPATAGALLDRRAIVVLPFANQSPDPDNEYFSDGLTEEIISDLAAIKPLQVISRTSAMLLKGTTKDVRTIGRELGVRYVLEGSVRKAGHSLRITAQLIDATTDSQLWGEKYAGTLDDVFELQERVSREIVAALGITLTSDEDRRLAHRSIENVRAFELYLQARQEMRRYGATAIEHGETLVRRAMEIEGATPPLQALLAWGKVSLVRAGLAPDRSGLDAAAAVANELLQTAPDAPYGHALLGFVNYERGQMVEGVRHLLAALELEPNDADAQFYLGICYVAVGATDAGARTAAKLMESDPLSPLAWLLSGLMPWWINAAANGLPKLVHAMEMDPGSVIIRWTLGYARALTGDVAGASRDAQLLLEQAPDMPYTSQLVALVHAMQGNQDAARVALGSAAGLDAHHKFHLAESYAMAGDTERAFELLEEAVSTGFHPGKFIAYHCPFLEPLRGTPRFEAIATTAIRLTEAFASAEGRT